MNWKYHYMYGSLIHMGGGIWTISSCSQDLFLALCLIVTRDRAQVTIHCAGYTKESAAIYRQTYIKGKHLTSRTVFSTSLHIIVYTLRWLSNFRLCPLKQSGAWKIKIVGLGCIHWKMDESNKGIVNFRIHMMKFSLSHKIVVQSH